MVCSYFESRRSASPLPRIGNVTWSSRATGDHIAEHWQQWHRRLDIAIEHFIADSIDHSPPKLKLAIGISCFMGIRYKAFSFSSYMQFCNVLFIHFVFANGFSLWDISYDLWSLKRSKQIYMFNSLTTLGQKCGNIVVKRSLRWILSNFTRMMANLQQWNVFFVVDTKTDKTNLQKKHSLGVRQYTEESVCVPLSRCNKNNLVAFSYSHICGFLWTKKKIMCEQLTQCRNEYWSIRPSHSEKRRLVSLYSMRLIFCSVDSERTRRSLPINKWWKKPEYTTHKFSGSERLAH